LNFLKFWIPYCVGEVKIINGYWLEDRGIVVRFLETARLAKSVKTGYGTGTHPATQWMLGPFPPVVKWPGRETDH
jgi:hypothetical protein